MNILHFTRLELELENIILFENSRNSHVLLVNFTQIFPCCELQKSTASSTEPIFTDCLTVFTFFTFV